MPLSMKSFRKRSRWIPCARTWFGRHTVLVWNRQILNVFNSVSCKKNIGAFFRCFFVYWNLYSANQCGTWLLKIHGEITFWRNTRTEKSCVGTEFNGVKTELRFFHDFGWDHWRKKEFFWYSAQSAFDGFYRNISWIRSPNNFMRFAG